MLSLRASIVASLAAGASASLYGESPYNHTCEIQADRNFLSCSAQANQKNVDSCCVETYGGLVLQTQFWSTYTGLESQGQLLPPNTWTIHGLWPDFCNGSYTQYCDLNRQYDPSPSPNTTNGEPGGTPIPPYKGPSVATFIEAFGRYDLLDYMNTYWIAQNQPNSDFWAHEQSKHQTCYSTFDVPCYGPKYVEHEDIIDFFDTVVKYWQRLPTFDFLKKHGVTPSNTTTYSLSDFETALAQEHGGSTPYVGCSGPRYNETAAGKGSSDNGRTSISEVWYYYHVVGRPQSGNAVPTPQTGKSSCATTKGALHYYETTKASVRQGIYPPSGQYSPSGPPAPPSPPTPPTRPSPPSPPTRPTPPSPPSYGPPTPPKYGPPAPPPHYI